MKGIQYSEGMLVSETVSYWVAGHLTGIFEIRDTHQDLLNKGSRGAGLSIKRGVITSVQASNRGECEIYFGNQKISRDLALVTSQVLDLLVPKRIQKTLKIEHRFQIPLSSGYGASAAGALGTAFALNDYLNLGYNDIHLFQIAHKSEVLNRGGLGDIIGLFHGGTELRIQEGAPGVGKTISLSKNNGWNVATVHLGSLETAGVLGDPSKRSAVNAAGAGLISELIQDPTFDNFIQYSRRFTIKANLASPRLKTHLALLPKGVIGAQIMLGEAYFIFYKNPEDLNSIKINTSIIREEICEQTVKRCL